MNWNGYFGNDYICIDETNDKYWILEHLYLKSFVTKNNLLPLEEISCFPISITLRYKKDNGLVDDIASVSIDYALYEMICNMSEGYRPTIQDKNIHADFISFTQRLMEFGNKSSRISLVPKDTNQKYTIIFEETEFDYEVKVI